MVVALLAIAVAAPVGAQQPGSNGRISLRAQLAANKLRLVNRSASALGDASRDGIRLDERANDGVAWVTGVQLDAGTIELDIRGRDVAQRSFVGVAFHGTAEKSYEVVYLRPFNYRATDPVRHKHAIQYVALPDYDFQRLRDEKADQFENPVLPEPEATAWVHLRLVVGADSVRAYVNGAAQPALAVPRLSTARGGEVGVWVGNNSDGEFANLVISRGQTP
jgi:hypothetical protein